MKLIKNWHQYNQHKKRRMYFLFFTLLFFVISLCCFGYFLIEGKSFFWINGGKDGLTQNYNCLVYFSNHLRTIFENIFIKHQFVIPQWDFGIGYGADTMTTMSIMTIGDPFNWFSVFVPEKFIHIFYPLMGFLRLYLAGIAFSLYCFKRKKKYSSIFIGAFIYMFCGYVFISLPRQVVFINPMVLLPLLLLSVEEIFYENKPYKFIILIAIAIIGSFQHFYILCLTVFVYCIIRFFCIFKINILHNIVKYITRFLFYAFIGFLIGSIIFIPVIIRFLGDGRASSSAIVTLLYPMNYYKLIVTNLISYQFPGGDWTFLTFTPISLIFVIVLFVSRLKEKIALKVVFIIGSLLLLTPIGGLIMNGLSFSSNRWIFVYSLLISYVFVDCYESINKLTIPKLSICLLCTSLYIIFCVCILDTKIEYSTPSLVILVIMMIYLIFANLKKIRSQYICFVVVFLCSMSGIIINAFFINSKNYKNYPSEFLDIQGSYNVLMNTGINGIHTLGDDEFYRYEDWNDQNHSFWNSGINYGIGSPNYFFSLSNPYSQEFYKVMNVGDGSPLYLQSLDSRSVLNSLASVKYIAVSDEKKNQIPAKGYKLIQNSKQNNQNVNIFQNENVLPLGYTYSEFISEKEFKSLSYTQKQDSLLKYIVLDSDKTSEKALSLNEARYLDNNVIPDKNIEYEHGKITVKKKSASISVYVPDSFKSDELYLTFQNLSYKSIKPNQYYSHQQNKKLPQSSKTYYKFWQPRKSSILTVEGACQKNIVLRNNNDIYFNPNKKDYSLNIQGVNKGTHKIKISFSEVGEYSFDKILIEPISLDNIESDVSVLKEDVLKNVYINGNKVVGSIDLNKDKFLCLSIPYTKGWTAYVDGEKVEIERANIMYMAIHLSEGKHSIELVYSTPGLKIGAFMTLCGIVSLLCLIKFRKNKSDI